MKIKIIYILHKVCISLIKNKMYMRANYNFYKNFVL